MGTIVIITILAAVILAFEIAMNSSLANEIKVALKLDLKSQKQLRVFSRIEFWNALWGLKLMYLLFPLTLMLTIEFTVYLKLNELFNCPYCLGYHLAWIGLVTITSTTLPMALLYALFSILFGKIYDKIN